MSFRESVETWTKLGEIDPLWAILSDPEKEGGKWNEADFFRSGVDEIEAALHTARDMGFALTFGSALDFGCGVGRLTQALGKRFVQVHGVDVAETMIARACASNRLPNVCKYHVNTRSDLSLFANDTFDFIYSRIVLQHIPPENSKEYVAEFVRVLKPGGLLAFQLSSELAQADHSAHPFHAEIVPGVHSLALMANQRNDIKVKVRNTSPKPWPAAPAGEDEKAFRLGNHWRSVERVMLVQDDGRASIQHDVAPGEEVEMVVQITAPKYGGDYLLELDMLQEGMAWFGDYGGAPPQVQVSVKGPSRWLAELPGRIGRKIKKTLFPPPVQPRVEQKPVFTMNAVPRDEVVQVISDSGGEMVAIRDDFSAGSAWVSFFYYVTKPAASD